LSEKEALVYLALLELGEGTVIEVARKANIKRPTAYLVVEELQKKGMVSEKPDAGRKVYIAEDPALLEKVVKQRLADYHELLPFFRAKFNRGQKPRIRYYEGREALSDLYLREVYPAEKVFYYGTSIRKLTVLFPEVVEAWEKIWWPKKKKTSDSVREIVNNEEEDVRYAKQAERGSVVRIAPKGMQFNADSAIADDKIVIVSLDNLFAIVIESKDLADTYRTLVELAWQSAVPVEKWEG
jgi:sugar-specific transcriptional regulator TrmB